MGWKTTGVIGTMLTALGIAFASPAHAIPGMPNCPGNGNDSVALGADGGWCNYMYLPDGTHVSCRWADFSFLIGEIGGHQECRIVNADGSLAPGSPPWNLMGDWGVQEGSGGQEPPPGP